VMSLPYLVKDEAHLKRTFQKVYGWFGLELDPLVYTQNIEEVEFLGFKPKLSPSGYVPLYNIGRIAASFKYVIEKHSVEASFAKAWSLVIMAAPGPEEVFDTMVEILKHVCVSFKHSTNPVVKSYINFGVPVRSECITFMLGLEGAPGWMEGFKMYDLHNEFFKSCKD